MENSTPFINGLSHNEYMKVKAPLNLHWIVLEEYENEILIASLHKYTGINNNLRINKEKKTIKSKNNFKSNLSVSAIRQYYFSLFIGIFKYKGINYLLFAENVSWISFAYEANVFEINTVVAISMKTYLVDPEVSENCTLIYGNNAYFSYDIDLTKPITKSNINTFKAKKSPNWPFFMNRNLLKMFFNEKVSAWIIPVIFGHVARFSIDLKQEGGRGIFYHVTRTSVLNILNKKADDPIIETLTSSDKVIQVCMIFETGKDSTEISFAMNNLPSEDKINLKHTCRFYQFMKKNFEASLYVICLEKDYEFDYVANMRSQEIVDTLDIVNILFLDKLNKSTVAEIYKESIENYISLDSKDNHTICFSVHDVYSFYDLYLPFISALFISSSRTKLCYENTGGLHYDNDHLYKCEDKISKTLSIYAKKRNVILKIHKYFDNINNRGFISGFFGALKSLVTGETHISKEKIVMGTRSLILAMFSVHESVIQSLIQEYRNSADKIFDSSELKISIITHNCSGYKPIHESDFNEFQYHKIPAVTDSDIVCVCLQEILAMKSENIKQIILEDNGEIKNTWRLFLSNLFTEKFEVLFTKNLLGLLTIIFVKRELVKKYDIKVHKTEFLRLGKLKFANKACIIIRMSVNYEKIDIINCHLSSGITEPDLVRRANDLRKVYSIIKNDNEPLVAFIVGDLNFRSKISTDEIQKKIKTYRATEDPEVRHQTVEEILKYDELLKVIEQQYFSDLKEHVIQFLPSYKFLIGTNEYDLANGKRIPSWCDRVLYKHNEYTKLTIDSYASDDSTLISDHKPVVFIGRIQVKEYNTSLFHTLFDEKY